MVTFTVKGGGMPRSRQRQRAARQWQTTTVALLPQRRAKARTSRPARQAKLIHQAFVNLPAAPGEYKDADADPIMIDFWLTGAKVKG